MGAGGRGRRELTHLDLQALVALGVVVGDNTVNLQNSQYDSGEEERFGLTMVALVSTTHDEDYQKNNPPVGVRELEAGPNGESKQD